MKTFKDFINEMSRPRKKVVSFVDGIQDTVQEHLWKVYAYGKNNPEPLTGWYISLSKHVKQFRIINVKKGGVTLNKSYMIKHIVDELFEEQDVRQLRLVYMDEYGDIDKIVLVATKEIRIIAERYVDFMLDMNNINTKVNHSNVFK